MEKKFWFIITLSLSVKSTGEKLYSNTITDYIADHNGRPQTIYNRAFKQAQTAWEAKYKASPAVLGGELVVDLFNFYQD